MCSKLTEKIIRVHYNDFYDHALHQNPNPRGHESYNFGRPFLGPYFISIYIVCLIYAME